MSGRFVKNSMLGGLAGGAIALASFISGIIVARTLSVNETGAVVYIIWLVWMVAPFVDLGMSSAIGRFVPFLRGSGQPDIAEQLGRKLARRLVLSSLGSAAAAAVIVWAFGGQAVATFLSGGMHSDAALLLVALVVGLVTGQTLATYAYALFKGQQHFGAAACVAGVSLLAQVLSVAIGARLFGMTGALAGYAVGTLLPAIVAVRGMFGGAMIQPDLNQRVTSFALYSWGANVTSAIVWSRIEFFFLERYWGMDAVAMFAIALALAQLAIQVPLLLTSAVLTSLAEKHGRDELAGMKENFATAVRLLAALVFPICFGTAAIMPALLPWLYGPDYAPATVAAMVLVAVASLSAVSTVGTHLVQALERSDFIFASSLCGAFFALAAGLALIPHYGVAGATIARVTIQILMIGLGCWFIVSRLRFAIPVLPLLKLAAAALTSAAAASLCINLISHPASLPLAVAAGVALYLIALRHMSVLEATDLAFLANATRALPPVVGAAAGRLAAFISATKQHERMM